MKLYSKSFVIMLFALNSACIFAQNDLTVNEVINKIKSEVKVDWATETVDNIKAGDPNTKITGIATTFMASLAVLQKAKAMGCNFIITHEPTFYSHSDNLKTHENDPIQEAKLKYILDNGLIVWRFHDHIHRIAPDQIYEGVIQKLGWESYKMDEKYIMAIPEMSLNEIVKQISKRMNAKTIRVVGDKNSKFSKVGLVLGAAGSGAHFKTLQNPDCELLIVGETNE